MAVKTNPIILVIEDYSDTRKLMSSLLRAHGYKVIEASDGREGLIQANRVTPDLILMDLAMPEMDGWETARAIRTRCPDINVILVTGYGTGTRPPAGEDGLVNGIIGKPFDFSQISQTITNVLANESMLENAGAL